MAVVPDTHDFTDGPALSSEMNSYVRDPIRFRAAPPLVHVLQTVAQSIPVFPTYTALTFATEVFDTINGHDNTTNPSRYAIAYPGIYLLTGGVSWAGNATGRRWSEWHVNGAALAGSQNVRAAGSASDITVPARTVFTFLSVGDYVELAVSQDSGGALLTYVGGPQAYSSMSIVHLST